MSVYCDLNRPSKANTEQMRQKGIVPVLHPPPVPLTGGAARLRNIFHPFRILESAPMVRTHLALGL